MTDEMSDLTRARSQVRRWRRNANNEVESYGMLSLSFLSLVAKEFRENRGVTIVGILNCQQLNLAI